MSVVAIDDPRRVVTTGMKALDTDAECSDPDCTERSWGWIELSEREQEVRRLEGKRDKELPWCLDHARRQLVLNLRELQAVWEVLSE